MMEKVKASMKRYLQATEESCKCTTYEEMKPKIVGRKSWTNKGEEKEEPSTSCTSNSVRQNRNNKKGAIRYAAARKSVKFGAHT